MVLTVISAIIVLGILILFHEFGHFVFAKCAGIRVDEFSIGLGPTLIQIKRGETIYKISLFPLGGYVKLAGMDVKDVPIETKGEPYEFPSKPPIIRAGTVIAGPIFNYILSLLTFTIILLVFGIPAIPTRIIKSTNSPLLQPKDEIVNINGKEVKTWDEIIENIFLQDSAKCVIKRKDELIEVILNSKDLSLTPFIPPVIGRVARDGPAWKAGLREGDLVTKIDDKEIQDWDTLVSIIQRNPEKEMFIEWIRDGKKMKTTVTPVREQTIVDGELKEVGMLKVEIKSVTRSVGGIESIKEGFLKTSSIIILTFHFFKKLLKREISPRKTLGGPIAILKFAGESARWGIKRFITLIGFLSLQLFIFNLIPFPPLDGGQMLLIVIEKIKRSPISYRTIRWIQNIGFAILILFLCYITLNDILRIIK